ncbi:hypothetical protein [Nitratidesulfovibrio liaohensis]|uniref:hypothetical protein n=1 Tax=Nitratidesulfovibrio liaohensis TaxID=2604158 RepID=UPI00142103EA|nr:hypothetical protein [Nitratidesulfovibrio liaohensis]NHZ48077.1 hypothetical protein [Nitratidesulfovibrio liaohensis]
MKMELQALPEHEYGTLAGGCCTPMGGCCMPGLLGEGKAKFRHVEYFLEFALCGVLPGSPRWYWAAGQAWRLNRAWQHGAVYQQRRNRDAK